MEQKDYKKMYEELQLLAVKQSGYVIKHIKNPSEELQLEAVKQNGYAIQFIENPSEEVQIEAVKQEPWSMKNFIKIPSERVQLEAVKQILTRKIIYEEGGAIHNLIKLLKKLENK